MKNSSKTRLGAFILQSGIIYTVITLMVLAIFTTKAVIASDAPDTGKKVYINHCASCHEGGFKGWITGAPKTGDKQKWAPFLKKGPDVMTRNTIKGTEGMEPMGGCKDCTEDQIISAVEYILRKTD